MPGSGRITRGRVTWWAFRAMMVARYHVIRNHPLESVRLPRTPRWTPVEEESTVLSVIDRFKISCLTRTFVRQAWYTGHGNPRDLMIGVRSPSNGFEAHAWLEGDPSTEYEGFEVLAKRPPVRT